MQHLTCTLSDVCRQYMSALSLVLPYAQIAYSALCSHLIGGPIEASHVME